MSEARTEHFTHNSINHPYDTKHPHTLSVPFKHVRLKDIPLSHLARLNEERATQVDTGQADTVLETLREQRQLHPNGPSRHKHDSA